MDFKSKYVSKKTDSRGLIQFSADENEVWHDLFKRMEKLLPDYACQEFIDGLRLLNIQPDSVPQLPDMNERLFDATGWRVAAVPALIPEHEFFTLLANKQFPAATFIRTREEFDYVTEPDIFHEYFGHCPMLTNQAYADFSEAYAKLVLESSPVEARLLQRLYWFTLEFGLIQTDAWLKSYGGGILSSHKETVYAVDSDIPVRKPLGDGLEALRTPYRIDHMQVSYFVINSLDDLYSLRSQDMHVLMARARELGEHPPRFPVEEGNPCIHIRCC